MADVISLLQPYAAYTLIDPTQDGDPYFTLGLIRPRATSHGIVRRLIYDFSFQHDEAVGQHIRIHHEAGDFILYGSNLSPVWRLLPDIDRLMVFDPTYHQPVTDSIAPIFSRMEVERYGERYARVHYSPKPQIQNS